MLLCGRSLFYLAFVLIICWTFGFTPIFRRSQQEQHDLQRKRQSPSSVSESVVERDAARLTYNKAPISVEINTVIVTGAGALNTPTHRDEDIRFEHVLMEVPYPDLARKASLVSREPILPEINKDIVEVNSKRHLAQTGPDFVDSSIAPCVAIRELKCLLRLP